jgi:tetratricopeptide (TPR) repeat protein
MDILSPLAANFRFWQPPKGFTVETGADSIAFTLPTIPLPISNSSDSVLVPTSGEIGSGLYDYLRQFPDCPFNVEYAELLRDAWPHYLADLAAMIVMLDHKDVDAPYLRRKISGLKILLLLNTSNPGLLQQLGIAFYELALNYVELGRCRSHLSKAMGYFSAADRLQPNDLANLNYLAQIDYLTGDYPNAIERWQKLLDRVEDKETQSAFAARIDKIKGVELPEHPLLVDLESIGDAMQMLGSGDHDQARMILEKLEHEQIVPTEFPNPEFYSLLAISRERCGDLGGAQESFARALELDPSHNDAIAGMDRLI